MKILFLDIDGVLTHYGSPGVDPGCFAELLRIVDATGARTVLSSDWKHALEDPWSWPDADSRFVQSLTDSIPGFLGTTPDVVPGTRADEIALWLEDAPDDVNAFVILDDIDDGLTDLFPESYVQTSGMPGGGLRPEQADRAIAILNADCQTR